MRTTFLAAALATALPLAATADTGVVATYEATADEIWALVDFHGPSERIMPPIAASTVSGQGLGATKLNTMEGGGDIRLLLVYWSPEARAFNYTITESPLPVANYVGEVRVREAGEGRAQLSWQGTYDGAGVSEEEADAILGGFYESIAARIGEIHPRVD